MQPRLGKINPAATYSRPCGLPSAGTGLTTVFGMGTGVAPSVKPPENSEAREGAWYSVVKGGRSLALAARRVVRPSGEIVAKGSC